MKNRNSKHIENILDAISENFDLSVNEENIVESFLILLKDGEIKKLKQVEHLLIEEFDELLETIPNNTLRRYCESELDMADSQVESGLEDALDDLDYKWSSKIDFEKTISICEDEGYEVLEKETTSIVEDMQMEEMKELFLNLSCAEKEELINKLRK